MGVSRLKARTLTAISACLFVLKSLIRMVKHFFSVLNLNPFLVTYAQRETDEVVLISLGILDGAHLCWVTEPSVACDLME